MENLLLYDWFSMTVPLDGQYAYEEGGDLASGLAIRELLGMADRPWETSPGTKGFSLRLWFDGISIHLPSERMQHVWLEMSGTGCRAFETYGTGNWEELFSFGLKYGHITRLDVSFDDHSGILDMRTLFLDTYFERDYVSKCNIHEVIGKIDDRSDSYEHSIYHGSPTSLLRIRIYDKAAQLHKDEHWTRVEMELHDERASAWLEQPGEIGEKWSGTLLNYLKYVDPDPTDSNRSRWPLKPYWAELLQGAQPIKLAVKPGVEYNMMNLEDFVFRQAGNSIWTYIQLYGEEAFLKRLKEDRPAMSEKLKELIRKYKRQPSSYGVDKGGKENEGRKQDPG